MPLGWKIMPFCENCGAVIGAEDKFCENCGEKVFAYPVTGDHTSSAIPESMNIFNDSQWQRKWQDFVRHSRGKSGIILTRGSRLLQELAGVSREDLLQTIARYINDSAAAGISYAYCDVENSCFPPPQDLDSLLDLLNTINSVAAPAYLFIIGNEKVIETAIWEDRSGDDQDIASDMVYTMLKNASPWQYSWNIDKALKTGRLPVFPGETLTEFRHYFTTASAARNKLDPGRNYGLCAKVWQDTGENIFRHVSNFPIDISPEITLANISGNIPKNTSLYYFNLHGSSNSCFWYGQQGREYPEAFSPALFDRTADGFVIGVEACYGASYTGGLTAANSILLRAMTGGCVSFLGSSRIAYGGSDGRESCADKVISEFLLQISRGANAGAAHIAGLKKLISGSPVSDVEVKTAMEFALYGDPALSPCCKHLTGLLSDVPILNIFGITPDIITPLNITLHTVNDKINRLVDEHIHRNFFPYMNEHEFAGVIRKSFRLPEAKLNHKSFTVQEKTGPRIIKVYFDDSGSIKKICESR